MVARAGGLAGGWNAVKDPDNGGTWGVLKLIDYVIPIGAPPFPWHIGSK